MAPAELDPERGLLLPLDLFALEEEVEDGTGGGVLL